MKRLIGMMLVIVALLLAPAAAAQDPTVEAYGGMAGDVAAALVQAGDVAAAGLEEAPAVQTLPFTGFDAALVLAAALGLVAVGIGLRRAAPNRS